MREIEKSIGIDIGKRKCVTCVTDADGTVLEESWYHNTADGACRFAARARAEYGTSKAACESIGNRWVKTADAFENAGIPLELANPLKTKVLCDRSLSEVTTAHEADCRGSAAVPPPCGPVPAQMPRRLPHADAFQWSASSLT